MSGIFDESYVINRILAMLKALPVSIPIETDTSKMIQTALPSFNYNLQCMVKWGHLTKTILLDTNSIPGISPKWRYTFSLPFDYINMKRLYTQQDYDIRGKLIGFNDSSLLVDYIGYSLDYSIIPPWYEDCLVKYAVREIAFPYTYDTPYTDYCNTVFVSALDQAKTNEMLLVSKIQKNYASPYASNIV